MASNNKEILLYNGTVALKYLDSNHSYWIAPVDKKTKKPGKYERQTGVTTYIGIIDKSFVLKTWVARIMAKFLHGVLQVRAITKFDIEEARNIHTQYLKDASDLGTKIHDWLEMFVKGQNPPMPEEAAVLTGVNSWLAWVEKHQAHFVAAEVMIYSKEYGYCGQADFVCYFGDEWSKLYLGDYKSSNGLYSGVMIQTAPYARGIEEMGLTETLETQGTQEGIKIAARARKQGKKLSFVGRWAIRLEKRTEEEWQADMDEKGKVNESYKIFEAVPLDPDGDHIKEDMDAFVAAKILKGWDGDAYKRLEYYKKEYSL